MIIGTIDVEKPYWIKTALHAMVVEGSEMQQQSQSIKEMVKQLPPEMQEEVRDFIEFLLEKRVRKPKRELKLDWRGALRDLRDQYTSVQLQHRAPEWWGD